MNMMCAITLLQEATSKQTTPVKTIMMIVMMMMMIMMMAKRLAVKCAITLLREATRKQRGNKACCLSSVWTKHHHQSLWQRGYPPTPQLQGLHQEFAYLKLIPNFWDLEDQGLPTSTKAVNGLDQVFASRCWCCTRGNTKLLAQRAGVTL